MRPVTYSNLTNIWLNQVSSILRCSSHQGVHFPLGDKASQRGGGQPGSPSGGAARAASAASSISAALSQATSPFRTKSPRSRSASSSPVQNR